MRERVVAGPIPRAPYARRGAAVAARQPAQEPPRVEAVEELVTLGERSGARSEVVDRVIPEVKESVPPVARVPALGLVERTVHALGEVRRERVRDDDGAPLAHPPFDSGDHGGVREEARLERVPERRPGAPLLLVNEHLLVEEPAHERAELGEVALDVDRAEDLARRLRIGERREDPEEREGHLDWRRDAVDLGGVRTRDPGDEVGVEPAGDVDDVEDGRGEHAIPVRVGAGRWAPCRPNGGHGASFVRREGESL